MTILRARCFHVLTLGAVVLALALSGFAHRVAAQPSDPAVAAFLQSGGSLADICGDPSGDGAGGTPCPACTLWAFAACGPDAFHLRAVDFDRRSDLLPARALASVQGAPYLRPPGRAPPRL